MDTRASGQIISLTYHEISKDPRVLKQARALQSAGYDVHVFCDWPNELPQHESIDGVRITRFQWNSPQKVTTAFFHDQDYFVHARDELAKRFLPFAEACECLWPVLPYLEQRLGPNLLRRSRASYYKEKTGHERRRRMFEYLYLILRLKLIRVPMALSSGGGGVKEKAVTRRTLRDCPSAYRLLRRSLFQAEALVFAANFPDLDPEEKVAAVHAHDIYCLPAGVMLARNLGVPLVYDAHEYEPARATKMDTGCPELPELIENDCFPFVNRLITVSDGIGDLYAERYQGPRPTIVMNAPEVDVGALRNGAPVRPGLKAVREQVGLAPDVPLVVYTGGTQREKRGVDKVLEALTYLPGVHFAVLGPRHENDDRWLMRLANSLGVANRVTLLPPVDARDVPAAISSADVSFCLFQDVSLNHRLAMPNKLFEAAFGRIPIVVSNLPEMRRFVERLGIGLAADQEDPRAIAAAFKIIFEKKSDYKMTSESKKVLADIYSWEAQTRKLLSLYQEMIGCP